MEKALLALLFNIGKMVTPELKAELKRVLGELAVKAESTKNPVDDFIVKLLQMVLTD